MFLDGQRLESNRSDEEMEIEEEKEGNVEAQVTEREQGTASQETEAGEKEENVEAQVFSIVFTITAVLNYSVEQRRKSLQVGTI